MSLTVQPLACHQSQSHADRERDAELGRDGERLRRRQPRPLRPGDGERGPGDRERTSSARRDRVSSGMLVGGLVISRALQCRSQRGPCHELASSGSL
jgi:hypothetical protein